MTKKSWKWWINLGSIVLFSACNPPVPSEQKPDFPSTDQLRDETPAEAYENMLRRRVNRQGVVHYAGIRINDKALHSYIQYLEKRTDILPNAPQKERIASFINLYNAYVIRLVVRHYPISSILDIGMPDGVFPRADYNELFPVHPATPFALKVGRVGADSLSLDGLREFIFAEAKGDPRVVFTLVNGSVSAPRLKRTLYSADHLDEQLDKATEDFLNSPVKNILSPNKPRLSPVFERNYERFGGSDEAIVSFANRFIPVRILPDAVVVYGAYDWTLNGY